MQVSEKKFDDEKVKDAIDQEKNEGSLRSKWIAPSLTKKTGCNFHTKGHKEER